MKNRILFISLIFLFITSCVGSASKGLFGTGVSVALDPRSIGTQIDDSVMQKNLSARIILRDKKYLLPIDTKVLDGKIFLTGKIENNQSELWEGKKDERHHEQEAICIRFFIILNHTRNKKREKCTKVPFSVQKVLKKNVKN